MRNHRNFFFTGDSGKWRNFIISMLIRKSLVHYVYGKVTDLVKHLHTVGKKKV